MMAADAIGMTPMDTGEYLLGSVAVTPVFFESDGSIDPQTQNWSAEEIDQVLAKISEGVNWWSDLLDTFNSVHSLEFVIDDQYARDPFETGFEPIDRSSSNFNNYVTQFLASVGLGDAATISDGVRQFNHSQRMRLGTDWSFTIFVVDSSDDADGFFAAGGFSGAFAFAGGLFFVSPSTRPATTFAHEMGHIFWARDEYPGGASYTDRRGYYDTPALNASDNPDPNYQQQISIMRSGSPLQQAYSQFVSPATTLAMVGWQDSDGDGIFDLADVPLELDAVGYYDPLAAQYHFSGSATAVPLRNKNSSGPQSDITLNRISELQYRVDGGAWVTADQPDRPRATFDLVIPLLDPFGTIEFRVIDTSVGVTSEVLMGTPVMPLRRPANIGGVVYLDENDDQQRDATEPSLINTVINISQSDGSPLFGGVVRSNELDEGIVSGVAGVDLTALGSDIDSFVNVQASADAGGQKVFQALDFANLQMTERWTGDVKLMATFAQPVGAAEVQVVGVDPSAFARVEAYDASGNLLERTTSDELISGESISVRVADRLGRIASIQIFGHAGTAIAISEIRFGIEDQVTVGPDSGWSFANLADGTYRVELTPQRVIHQFDQSVFQIDVVGGQSAPLITAAHRVDSPRHNMSLAGDVNGDSSVTARDALIIINDLERNGTRDLTPSDIGSMWVDVSNDGRVTPLDALQVINSIDTQPPSEAESAVVASWNTGQDGGEFADLGSVTSPGQSDVVANRRQAWVNPMTTSPVPTESGRTMLDFSGGTPGDESDGTVGTDRNDQGTSVVFVLGSPMKAWPAIPLASEAFIGDFPLAQMGWSEAWRDGEGDWWSDVGVLELPELSEPFGDSSV